MSTNLNDLNQNMRGQVSSGIQFGIIVKLYKKAFGEEFDLGIEVPQYFTDQSYKNDACPCFVYEKGHDQIVLWIDYKESGRREVPAEKRYTLELRHQGEVVSILLSTDSTKVMENILSSAKQLDAFFAC